LARPAACRIATTSPQVPTCGGSGLSGNTVDCLPEDLRLS
jgi:hypothetical protein